MITQGIKNKSCGFMLDILTIIVNSYRCFWAIKYIDVFNGFTQYLFSVSKENCIKSLFAKVDILIKVNFEMKKRTAFIGAILSLLPFGQPLLIKTSVALSTTGLIFAVPEKVNANSVDSYLRKLDETYLIRGEENTTISYANKLLQIDPSNLDAYWYRAYAKVELGLYEDE